LEPSPSSNLVLAFEGTAFHGSSRKTFRRRVISRTTKAEALAKSRARKLKKLTRKDFASDEKSSTCRVGVAVQPTRKGAPSLRAQPTGGHQFAAHWPLAQPENHKSKLNMAAALASTFLTLGAPPVYCFSITGGPCAGKTTAMSHLLERQSELFPDYKVTVVPEAATLYHQYGARLPFGTAPSTCGNWSPEQRNLLWEALLCELKRTLEAETTNAAIKEERPSVVLCDRGIFDSRAYLPGVQEWNDMLELAGWNEANLVSRYDHVFHLAMCPADVVSAAFASGSFPFAHSLHVHRCRCLLLAAAAISSASAPVRLRPSDCSSSSSDETSSLSDLTVWPPVSHCTPRSTHRPTTMPGARRMTRLSPSMSARGMLGTRRTRMRTRTSAGWGTRASRQSWTHS
jgi:thymidylate kinase